MSSRPSGTKRSTFAAAAALAAITACSMFTAVPAHAAPASVPAAPAPDYQGLQEALKGVVAAGSPGAFARVSDRGGRGGTAAVGTGDVSTGKPVDPKGEFRIGSITKNFTAVLTLQLVARHQVDLDAPAVDRLPGGVLPAGSPITVRQLLNHTSGLYDYSNDLPGVLVGDTVTGFQQFRYKTYDPAGLVAGAVAHGSQFTPGSRYQYSNTNFVVLGLLVEHVTGKPFARVLNERVLWPLGMDDTRFVVPRKGIGGPHAIGYLTEDDRSKPLFDATEQTASWIWAAGAAISSTADLNTYWRGLTRGALLPKALLAEMEATQPVDSTGTSGYGLGLRRFILSCGTQVYGHDGILQGYQTYSYTTKDGARQLTVSANASNNSKVFTAERATLDPVFCGRPSSPSATRASSADSAHIAKEETVGVSPEPLRR
ncbi:serine hydrolase domain-containing protein [Streptomyces sp. DT24]|uniref:serine hydrolase domain-containing protein n=1 Tax=Streptomyces sp. DT24 TaxID=3416520 RepID=UPI003CEC8A94